MLKTIITLKKYVMNSQYLSTLIELQILGAKNPIKISTVEIAIILNKTQQTASQHLLYLEKNEFISRFKIDGNDMLQITNLGLNHLLTIVQKMQSAFDDEKSYSVSGKVFSGLGEGAYYISLMGYKKQFISKLGFEPYPGTLNLKLSSNLHKQFINNLSELTGVTINGFTDKKRSYGNVLCFPALINSSIKGSVILIERTHHDDSVLELISSFYLRKKLRLVDGDIVDVHVLV